MESTVKFRNRQEFQAADMNNLQTFARASLDHIAKDGIEPSRAYAGLTVTKTADTVATVSAGRLYVDGAVYGIDNSSPLDLFNYLPVTTEKIVGIVAWGQEIDTDVQSRDFLIDADTGTTEPDAVAMRSSRYCNISVVAGDEDASPAYPTLSANVLAVAWVRLDTNGIVSITPVSANKIENVRSVSNRVATLEYWRTVVGAQVENLRSDLFALAARVSAMFAEVYASISALARRIEELEAKVNQPVSQVSYLEFTNNHFLDMEDVNDQVAGYDCRVFEGIRLPYAASDVGALALLNPQDVNAKVNDNILLPNYSAVARVNTGTHDAELRLAVYTYQTQTIAKRQMSRTRIRYGTYFTICTNAAFWRTGVYDPITHVFKRNGETYVVEGTPPWLGGPVAGWWWWWHWGWHGVIRLRQYWVDTVTEDYWSLNTTDHSVVGQTIAQTHLVSQDGWLVGLAPKFTRVAASGDVTLMIAETTAGAPDMEKVIMHTTVPVADLKTDKSMIAIPPTFLKAGKRYALVMATAGDHYVGTTTSANDVLQGTLFYATDGGYFQGVLDKDLCCDWHFAKWSKTRYALDCDPFVLAGGIHDIDVLADAITPGATGLAYEVQINGLWRPLGGENAVSLSALPPLLPLRIVFNGTADVMPAVGVNERSQVILSRPKTAAVCWSKNRTLGSGTTSVKLMYRLEGFNDTVHDFTAKLYTGGSYATEETPDVVSDFTMPDGSIKRTLTFNIVSATQYRIKTEMSVSSIDSVFHVAEMVEYAAA